MEDLLFVVENKIIVEKNIVTKRTQRRFDYLKNYKIVYSSPELVIFGYDQILDVLTSKGSFQIVYPFKLNFKTIMVIDDYIVARDSYHVISIYNLRIKKMLIGRYSVPYNQILKLNNGIIAIIIGSFTLVDNPHQMNEKCLIFKSIMDGFNKLCGKCVEYGIISLSTFSFWVSKDSKIVEFEYGIENRNHLIRIFAEPETNVAYGNNKFKYGFDEIEIEPHQIKLSKNRVAVLDGKIYLWDNQKMLVIEDTLEYSIENVFRVEKYNSYYGVWINASLDTYKIDNYQWIQVDLNNSTNIDMCSNSENDMDLDDDSDPEWMPI